jgi:hypothetical protein
MKHLVGWKPGNLTQKECNGGGGRAITTLPLTFQPFGRPYEEINIINFCCNICGVLTVLGVSNHYFNPQVSVLTTGFTCVNIRSLGFRPAQCVYDAHNKHTTFLQQHVPPGLFHIATMCFQLCGFSFFAKLRKATISSFASVRPHETTRLLLKGFSLYSYF